MNILELKKFTAGKRHEENLNNRMTIETLGIWSKI
jgi:hypothetical protein